MLLDTIFGCHGFLNFGFCQYFWLSWISEYCWLSIFLVVMDSLQMVAVDTTYTNARMVGYGFLYGWLLCISVQIVAMDVPSDGCYGFLRWLLWISV